MRSLFFTYTFLRFLRAFEKLRKATISFVMSVRPSVRMEQLDSHWTDFDEFWYFRFFLKSVEKIQVYLKSGKNNGYFTQRFFTFMTISRLIPLTLRNVLDKSCRENQNTRFMFNNIFRKSCRLWDNVERFGGAEQAQKKNTVRYGECALHAW